MRLLALCLTLTLAGCASAGPTLLVSGEGLKAVGTQFVATSTAVTDACVAKKLTLTQCDSFRTFSRKFKVTFPDAVKLQENAMAFNDKTVAQLAADAIAILVTELGTYTSLLVGGK